MIKSDLESGLAPLYLCGLIETTAFEAVYPRKFCLVCFKLRCKKRMYEEMDEGGKLSVDSKLTKELMESVKLTGKAFLNGE